MPPAGEGGEASNQVISDNYKSGSATTTFRGSAWPCDVADCWVFGGPDDHGLTGEAIEA